MTCSTNDKRFDICEIASDRVIRSPATAPNTPHFAGERAPTNYTIVQTSSPKSLDPEAYPNEIEETR